MLNFLVRYFINMYSYILLQLSGKMKTKISLIEVPEVKVSYESGGREEVYSAVRTNYPKQSQLITAGFLRDLGDVKIVDMKIRDSNREELYKQFPYGDGKIKCYKKGASFESLENIVKDSDIIGLTSNFTRSAGLVIDFIEYAKKINSKAKIVLGGSDATPRYEYYLRNGADIVILGEGESIGPKVIQAISKSRPLDDLSGIAYKDGDAIKYNPRNSLTDKVNVNDIPLPAFDLVGSDLEKYTEAFEGPLPSNVKTPVGILETSRGCAEACPFCTTPSLRKGYRHMSTERIEELIKHYKKFGIETLILMEDNILSRLTLPNGREKVIEMFNLLKQNGFAWEFGNGLEIGKLMNNNRIDEELIEKMFYHDAQDGKYIGAYRVYTPLESLHQEPNKVYKKLRPYDQELEIIKAMASTRIPMMTFGTIIGRPNNDDKASLKLTEERCLEIKKIVEEKGVQTYFTPFLNILLPGTPDYKKYKHVLKYDIEEYPELYHFHTATLKTKDFTPAELTVFKREMEERINGSEARKVWGSTGKYYFKK